MASLFNSLFGGTTSGKEWPIVGGRAIYDLPSISGLNKTPIDTLSAFVLQGINATGSPGFGMEELVERRLVDGCFVLMDVAVLPPRFKRDDAAAQSRKADKPQQPQEDPAPGQKFQFLDGLVLHEEATPFGRKQFSQRFSGEVPGRQGLVIIERQFKQGEDGGWTVADYVMQDHKLLKSQTLKQDEVRVFMFDQGVLYPAQKGYRRLEEIFVSLRKLQTGINAKTLIFGYVGHAGQASAALNDPDSDVANMPGATSASRVASTAAVDQLIRELESLLPRYLASVHIVDTSHLDRTATVSRRLLMLPMLNFVEKVRRELTLVLAEFSTEATFERIRVDGIDERIRQYELLKLMRDDTVLTPEQFKAEAGALINLRGDNGQRTQPAA